VGVKASGGIKTAQHVRDLVAAGEGLVGTSSGVQIVEEVLGGLAPVAKDSAAQY